MQSDDIPDNQSDHDDSTSNPSTDDEHFEVDSDAETVLMGYTGPLEDDFMHTPIKKWSRGLHRQGVSYEDFRNANDETRYVVTNDLGAPDGELYPASSYQLYGKLEYTKSGLHIVPFNCCDTTAAPSFILEDLPYCHAVYMRGPGTRVLKRCDHHKLLCCPHTGISDRQDYSTLIMKDPGYSLLHRVAKQEAGLGDLIGQFLGQKTRNFVGLMYSLGEPTQFKFGGILQRWFVEFDLTTFIMRHLKILHVFERLSKSYAAEFRSKVYKHIVQGPHSSISGKKCLKMTRHRLEHISESKEDFMIQQSRHTADHILYAQDFLWICEYIHSGTRQDHSMAFLYKNDDAQKKLCENIHSLSSSTSMKMVERVFFPKFMYFSICPHVACTPRSWFDSYFPVGRNHEDEFLTSWMLFKETRVYHLSIFFENLRDSDIYEGYMGPYNPFLHFEDDRPCACIQNRLTLFNQCADMAREIFGPICFFNPD